LWSKADVAERLGVTVRTVDRMPIPRVSLPSSGRKPIVRFDPDQVEAWINSKRSRPLAVVTKKAG
jgi:hypothetical protein